MSLEILQALAKLDQDNDDHWTSDGLPRLDVLKDLGVEVSRVELNTAAKGFGRKSTHVLKDLLPGEAPQETVVNPDPVQAQVLEAQQDKLDYEQAPLTQQEGELAEARLELAEATEALNAAIAAHEVTRLAVEKATNDYNRAVEVVEREEAETAEERRHNDLQAYFASQQRLREAGAELQ